ncbi:hypothetical protein NDU88_003595 [Pleurodeles waltl]|uniref:Uncharacterized protein n=1 Tax=Pleurodeles waltl TaxID=8319 RepID=A0AAV7V168_PLEWA|nr:hypothetical protein NDU88_003595 [Pleurodeles waltl]
MRGRGSELVPLRSAARIGLSATPGEGGRSKRTAPEQGHRRCLTFAGVRASPPAVGSDSSAPGTRPWPSAQPLRCRRRHVPMAPANEPRPPRVSSAFPETAARFLVPEVPQSGLD